MTPCPCPPERAVPALWVSLLLLAGCAGMPPAPPTLLPVVHSGVQPLPSPAPVPTVLARRLAGTGCAPGQVLVVRESPRRNPLITYLVAPGPEPAPLPECVGLDAGLGLPDDASQTLLRLRRQADGSWRAVEIVAERGR